MNNTRNRINKLNYQDQLISKKIANINKILSVLKRCKISRENHKSFLEILIQLLLLQILNV
jgi:hypothetical protein